MAVRLSSATWVRGITDRSIARVVGAASLSRGQAYARSGAVLTLVEGAQGDLLLATVRGSGSRRYQTVIELLDGSVSSEPDWSGKCSCPVGVDCKHTAAVVLTAREALGSVAPPALASWEQQLAPLTASATSTPDLPGLGLEMSLVSRPAYPGQPAGTRVAIRPLRPGKSKAWVKQGVNWSDFGPGWRQAKVRPDHRALMTEILALHRSGSPAYYGYGNPEVHLADLSAAVWPLLHRCIGAGISLVAQGSDLVSVQLLDEPASVVLDVTRQSADGPLSVRPVLRGPNTHANKADTAAPRSTETELRRGHDDGGDPPSDDGGGLLPGDGDGLLPGDGDGPPPDDENLGGTDTELILLGRPPHGVAALRPDGRLTLAQLVAPPPEALIPLLTSGADITVPASDTPRFLTLYYPMLARQLPAQSSDGSVALPADAEPVLTLDATYDSGHRVRLSWGFGYRLPGEHEEEAMVRVGLQASEHDPPRDFEYERRLLDSLTELAAIPRMTHRSASGVVQPYPQGGLFGMDTVTFSTQVMPSLQARDDVVVRVEGEPPAYQEADEAPMVHLTTVDDEEQADSDWFDLHVSVTVDGQQVPFGPLFTALARDEEVMLLDSGTWFTLDRPELHSLRTLIEEARELTDAQGDTLRVSRYQVDLWDELEALGVIEQQSSRWGESIAALRGLGQDPPPPVPTGLRATLRPYQLDGYQWLAALWDARLGGVLADDMGLGKTLQTLAMASRAKERGELDAPLLVVAPASVVGTWLDEAARFTPELRVVAITATGRRRGMPLPQAVAGAHLVVTSYTLLRLEDEQYRSLPWSGLVLDEAQFVKNHRSRTYQAARRLGAPFTLAITGTPLENSLMDLWSMLSLSSPGLFPRPEIFAERYRKPIESGTSPEQLAVLRRRVRPFMLRRTKAEVAPELPDKQEQVVHVELSPAHRRIYGQHLQRERQRVLGLLADLDHNRIAIFRALTLLRQLSLDPVLVDPAYAGTAPSAKIEALLDQLVEVTAEGHRALVFSSFTGFLKLVRDRLDDAGIGYSYLDGRTRDRPKRIAAWRTGGDPVFLISLKAGGFGLTLTEADYVFILDPWWNPAAETQAVDRTHRIGQTRPVMVYRMVSQDTIEDKVVALQARKRDLFAKVVDGGEFSGAAISADDIQELLQG